jgi:carbonic anhydrase
MTLTNTGHTVQVTPPAGSYIVVGGTRYDLVQFHFHHPGEEAVKGKLPDMTLHLVHKSADGKFAVVAVRLNEGNPQPACCPPTAATGPTKARSPRRPAPKASAGSSSSSKSKSPATSSKAFGALYKVNSRLIQDTHGRKIEASE